MSAPGSQTDAEACLVVSTAQSSTPNVSIRFNYHTLEAPMGQSILTVVSRHQKVLRHHLTDSRPVAGFCLMGACQECWLWLAEGTRVRACT